MNKKGNQNYRDSKTLFRKSDYIYSQISNPFVEKIYRHLFYGKEKKQFKKSGSFADKTFYVIRVRYDNCGIMAYFRYVLSKIWYATQKGYIPVVDMQNGKNAYLTKEEIGKVNTWEYFFEQPAGYSLEDINDAKNVIFSSLNHCEPKSFYVQKIYDIAEKYIRFNKEIEEKIQKVLETWKKDNREYVLGLKLRGTDYVSTRPSRHALQPTVNEFIDSIEEIVQQTSKKIDLFYLATEDEDIKNVLSEHYKEQLYTIDIKRLKADETWYKSELFLNNKRESGVDYCVEVGVLSRCSAIIASESQGTMAAIIMNAGKYDFLHLVNEGKVYD